jgi:2-isopropylmalate synthase
MFSQGVDPGLDLSRINDIRDVYQACTGMVVPERHPYAGELVYTAFSGSHQDAIRKGMKSRRESQDPIWAVPYLPIDPQDVGRTYEKIVRINSQSGKGGVAYVMEQEFGFKLPKAMHPEFGRIIQSVTDRTGEELSPAEILERFEQEYLQPVYPYQLREYHIHSDSNQAEGGERVPTRIRAVVRVNGSQVRFESTGNGPIDAFVKGLCDAARIQFAVDTYEEHAMGAGSDSRAVAYVGIQTATGSRYFGAGLDSNISVASIQAILSALNRSPLEELRARGATRR